MPALYLSTPGSVLRRARGRLYVDLGGERHALGPLAHIERVCVMGAVTLTPPALNLLLGSGCTVVFLTRTGRLKGVLARPATGDTRGRLAHVYAAGRPELRLRLAADRVRRKTEAMRALLAERHRRTPTEALRKAVRRLDRYAAGVTAARTVESLRGLEGTATAVYYRAFAGLFTGPLAFPGRRSRRPPRDPVNALLSFLYVLLTAEAAEVLTVYGLDPALGFLHSYRAGRPSLACDLVEPFRPLAVDRLVLRLCNRHEVRAEHFAADGQGGVRLTPAGMPVVLSAWETLLQEQVPAYAAAALAVSPDGPAGAPVLTGLRGLLHAHGRDLRTTLLGAADLEAWFA